MVVGRVDMIQKAIREGGSLQDAARRWAGWIVQAARLARALTAKQAVKYLATRGVVTTTNAIRKAGEKSRFWSTKQRVPGQRRKARVYDPKELVIYFRNVRADPNYYRGENWLEGRGSRR